MAWYTLFTRTLTGTQGGNGETFRQVIPPSAYSIGAPQTGTQLRITLQAASFGALNTLNSYVGHSLPTGDPSDFDGTQVPTLFSGSAGTNVPTGTQKVSDAATYAFDKTKPLAVSVSATFPGWYAIEADSVITYYRCSGDLASVTDFTPGGSVTASAVIPKVEVFFNDPPGNATSTIDKNTGQLDPTSATSIAFRVSFNKGMVGFTAADIDTSASTVTWIGGTPNVVITGSDFNYVVTISGMLTAGNVVMTFPASCCTAVSDAAPNALPTIIDNTVSWDPNIINPIGPNVYEVCTIDSDMLRIEVRDPPMPMGSFVQLSAPDSGEGTHPVTGCVDNGHGQIRLTCPSYIGWVGNNWSHYIQNMTNNGSGLIRCTIYDLNLVWPSTGRPIGPLTGDGVSINHARGTVEANGFWIITRIDDTHFDLQGSTFTNTYTGGGILLDFNAGSKRIAVHSIGGVPAANGAWVSARSGTNTIDLQDSAFSGGPYTTGGTVVQRAGFILRPNPAKGGTLDYCTVIGRFADAWRFQDDKPPVEHRLERLSMYVAANYTISGGLTITAVHKKIKPYSLGYGAYNGPGFSSAATFRYYFYLKLSSNLVSGTTYTITFPTGSALPPKTFTFNDKVTRLASVHVDQAGHRPSDTGKIAYLSEWVPDYAVHGEMDYSAITNWHLIDEAGTVVFSKGAAPVFRIGPTDREGVSFNSPQTPQSKPLLVRDEGRALKVSGITKASPGVVTVDDGSLLTNGEMVAFASLAHYPVFSESQGAKVGMWQLETDGTLGANPGNPYYFRVNGKSGNTFQLSVAKSVSSATVVSGGTGYAVGDLINIAVGATTLFTSGVTLRVATVSGSAVATVTPRANEEVYLGYYPSQGPARSTGSGMIDYPYSVPSNPQAQSSSSGGGSLATFNLTWTDAAFDRTLVGDGIAFGSPNTTALPDFVQSRPGTDKGNLLYKVNELGNKASTNIYHMDFSSFTTPGTYRLYIAGRGVSDPIHLNDAVWWSVTQNYLKGMYHERQGCVLDGRFGFTRGPGFKPRNGPWTGTGPFTVIKSYATYATSDYAIDGVGYTTNDVHAADGETPGYSPYIHTGPTRFETAFGGHVDAGDWDVRINETGWFYWQMLDVYHYLPAAAKASVANMGFPTLLECGLDPTIYAGTDAMPHLVAECIWGLELFRASQRPDGSTIGGLNYGEGVPDAENSSTTTFSIYSWHPDHYNTYLYAACAAKLAKVLATLGYATLSNTYRDSAIAAYDWAVSISTNAAIRDAHYLPTKTAARWTTPQYDSNVTQMELKVPQARGLAAAALFSLTGTTTYKTYCDGIYNPGSLASIDIRNSFGAWEYARAPGATGANVTAIRTKFLEFANNNLLLFAEAPDVSYWFPSFAGVWVMNFGAGNNFQFTQHLIIAATIYAQDESAGSANVQRCLRALQKWFGHRHGACQIGLCMTSGIGVRNNRETLHIDSRSTSQALPPGLCSEGWANLFPALSNTQGQSWSNAVQSPDYDPESISSDPTVINREKYPYDSLAWPRWEFFIELQSAIEHSEYTTQQQIMGALAGSMFLHGWDDNAATEELPEPPVEPGEPRFNPGLALRMRLRNSLLVMALAGGATIGAPTNLVSALMANPSYTTFILNDGFYTGGAINSTVLAGRPNLTIRAASQWGAKLGGIGLEAPNITLDGVEVTYPGTPINVTSTGAKVLNCRVHNFGHTEFGIGIWVRKSGLSPSKRVIIRGNTVTNWGDETFAGGIAIGEAADVQDITAVVAEITDNTITDGPTAPGLLSGAIQSFHPCIVSGNFIHTVSGQGIQIKTINSTIRNNECVNVLFDGALYNRFPPEGNNQWLNNLVHDCDVGIDHFMGSSVVYFGNVIYNCDHFGRIKNQGDSDQVLIQNNTFWNSTGSSGGWIWDLTDPGTPIMEIVFTDNIWDTTVGPAIQAAPTVTWLEFNNIFWNTTAPSPIGSGSSVTNPLLTSPPTNFTATAPAAAGKGATWPIPV